jgi:hypothetical protein
MQMVRILILLNIFAVIIYYFKLSKMMKIKINFLYKTTLTYIYFISNLLDKATMIHI